MVRAAGQQQLSEGQEVGDGGGQPRAAVGERARLRAQAVIVEGCQRPVGLLVARHSFDIKAGPGPLTDFGSARGLRPFLVGDQDLSAAQLLALPADPARLKALIMKNYDPTTGQSADSYLFQVTPVLLTMPVTPAVRAAFYQMLADLPGVRSLGQVRDTAGRDGVAVALSDRYRGCGNEMFLGKGRPSGPTFSACVVQQRLVIDPDTGLPLAQELRYLKLPVGQAWSAPGGLLSYEFFGAAHWTNANPPHYAN